MGLENRAAILLKIQTLILDNLNKEISAADMRSVLNDLADSMFNMIDEPRTAVPNVSFFINNDDTVSGLQAFEGVITIDLTSEIISNNIINAYYEASLDGIVWENPVGVNSDLADLQTWITNNITLPSDKFFVRAYGVYAVGEKGEGVIKFEYE